MLAPVDQYRLQPAVLVVLAVLAALSAPALGSTGAGLSVSFTTGATNSPTAGGITATLSDPSAPGGKPAPVRQLRLDLPIGTTFDTTALDQCSATLTALIAAPSRACPDSTKIGDGAAEAISGLPGVDPVVENLTAYNGPNTILLVAVPAGAFGYTAAMQANIGGSAVFATFPTFCLPGGSPPDCAAGEVSISKFQLALRETTSGARSYLRTPPTCPTGGSWPSSALFTLADGTNVSATSVAPCTTPLPPPVEARAPCRVPRLNGKRLPAARRVAKRAHCRLGRVTSRRAARRMRGRVLGQRPAPGAVRPAGSKIAVTVGR